MDNGKILNTSSQDSIQQELDKLNAILSERLTFDPFSVDDETLWSLVLNRDNAQSHNYHCMIIRFGEIYSVYENTPYASNRIRIHYADQVGSKNVKDFRFTVFVSKNKQTCNEIINPFVFHDCKKGLLGKDLDLKELLENKLFFLMQSQEGLNKFGCKKFVWKLVMLCDDVSTNVKIIREYILKAQIQAYREILKSPQKFGINLPIKEIEKIISPLSKKVSDTIYHHSFNETGMFIKKIDNSPVVDDYQE
ncbi:MAG: hypothetical protein HDS11_04730 [Bacteroides sp.]|nr:hypothetical protein [Bacteroides sp.]MBD5378236.1 hypothetical protein [Bacteroides sp.]